MDMKSADANVGNLENKMAECAITTEK